jgi:hypothetical protein
VQDILTEIGQHGQDLHSGGWISGGELITVGNKLNVSTGVGYARNPVGHVVRVEWGNFTDQNITAGINYISVNYAGVLQIGASIPGPDQVYLGLTYLSASGTSLYANEPLRGYEANYYQNIYMRNGIGPLVLTGLSANIGNMSNLSVIVSTGSVLTVTDTQIVSEITSYRRFYQNGSEQWTFAGINDSVSVTQYNDIENGLVSLTSGYYTKHLIIVDYNRDVGYFIYGQAEYETLADAEAAPLPATPASLTSFSVNVAAFVVNENTTTLAGATYDVRPSLSRLFGSSQLGAVGGTATAHSSLTGLTVGNDHPQYLLRDGTQSMTGGLNMGGNAISNALSVTATTLFGNLDWSYIQNEPAFLTNETYFLVANATLARTGTCPVGTVVQNTTNQGVQCIAFGGTYSAGTGLELSGNVFSVNETYLQRYNETARLDVVNATAVSKASPGNCSAGFVVQNTTTGGVQCVAVSNLFVPVFGEIFDLGPTTQTMTTQNVWYTVATWSAGENNSITLDTANSRLQVVDAGLYELMFSLSATVNNNDALEYQVLNSTGVLQKGSINQRYNNGQYVSLTWHFKTRLNAGDYAYIQVRDTTRNGAQITFAEKVFSIEKVSS